MTTFKQFVAHCKIRHDFADQIQVRYQHSQGETYDTWVSGEEAWQRLRSEDSESRLRGLSRLKKDDLHNTWESLPEQGKRKAEEIFRDRITDNIEEFVGGNLIGDSLIGALRGGAEESSDRQQWQERLQQEKFRATILELAWINLRGSFPEEDGAGELDDWV